MLEDKDIQKLKEELATKKDLERFATKEDLAKQKEEIITKAMEVFPLKEEVATKQDFEELRKDFARLKSAVDAYAKKADTYFQEMVMLSHKVDRHEKWIQQLAKKLGVKLEY